MRVRLLRLLTLGAATALLASWVSPLVWAQPDQFPERGEPVLCGSTRDSTPTGLVVVLPSGEHNYHSMNLQALNNPFVSGVAVQINWRDIEPVQGKPDWSKLDALFAAAISSQKWVQLDIIPGFFLLNGPWQEQRPICSSYHMALTMAPSRSFPCHGI